MNRIYGIGDEEELANDLQEEMKRMIPIEVLDKIRADVINIADSRRSMSVRSVINIIDKYRESEE